MAGSRFDPEKDIPSLSGKVIFVTGGTAGLGAGFISALAKHDPAQIFFNGRNQKAGDALIRDLGESCPNVKVIFLRCDMSSFSSIRECTNAVKASTDRLDLVLLNAGIMATDPALSKDGYEIQFAINQMSHALLVKLLLPLLQQTAQSPGSDVRVVNMSSIAYEQAPKQGIDFDTLRTKQEKLGMLPKWARYGQSKLAQMLYTEELAKHYPEITWVSVHPGYIFTGLFDGVDFLTKLPVMIMSMGKRTPISEGHYQASWAATCDKSKLKNGEYYEPIGVLGTRSTKQAKDKKLAGKLWEWTQEELKSWE